MRLSLLILAGASQLFAAFGQVLLELPVIRVGSLELPDVGTWFLLFFLPLEL